MAMSKRTMILLAVLAVPGLLHAGMLEYGYYGMRDAASSGATAALNLSGVSLKEYGSVANPALPACGKGLAVALSGGLSWRRETRNREVFDSYSNSVGLNTESVNSETRFAPQSVALSYAATVGPLPRLALSFSARPEYDFHYHYAREVRDGFFSVIQQYATEAKGQIYGYSFALSCRPVAWAAAGIGFTRLAGTQDITSSSLYEDPTASDSVLSSSNRYRGGRLDVGLWGEVNDRISVGAAWRSPSKLTQTLHLEQTVGTAFAVFDTTGNVTYPAEFTMGVSYRPTNAFPATVTLEYSYMPWNKLTNDLDTGRTYAAVHRYSMGITHRVADQLPLHFGVSFENSYQNRGIGLARAGIGTEVSLLNVTAQIGASAGRRSYNEGQAFGTTSVINVSETFADLVLTFTMK